MPYTGPLPRAFTEHDFQEILGLKEQRAVEYKHGLPWRSKTEFSLRIVKACLALANHPVGGVIIVGIEDDSTPAGISSDDAATWREDEISEYINTFADPPVQLQVQQFETRVNDESRIFIVIHVEAFQDHPVICIRELVRGDEKVFPGELFVRSQSKRESARIKRSEDLREILKRAIDLGVHDFVRRAKDAGLLEIPSIEAEEKGIEPRYSTQVQTALERIEEPLQTRGWWRVVVHPTSFRPDRIEKTQRLRGLLEELTVALRGWNFPHIDHQPPPEVHEDSISQSIAWTHLIEFWEFCQSGLFLQARALWTDWIGQTPIDGVVWNPGEILSVGDTLYQLFETFSFARRWARLVPGSDGMAISTSLVDLEGRQLKDFGRTMQVPFSTKASVKRWDQEVTTDRAILIADAESLALEWAQDLFYRFGWDVSTETLKAICENMRIKMWA